MLQFQFYLLSVVSLVLSGLVLSGDYLGARIPALATFRAWLENRGAAIALGLATAVIGFIVLIERAPGAGGRVAGDLLPALAGLAVGLALFFEAVLRKPAAQERPVEKVAKAVLTYRVPLGVAAIVIALLHFLFPRALII
jgi:hypothetical protein